MGSDDDGRNLSKDLKTFADGLSTSPTGSGRALAAPNAHVYDEKKRFAGEHRLGHRIGEYYKRLSKAGRKFLSMETISSSLRVHVNIEGLPDAVLGLTRTMSDLTVEMLALAGVDKNSLVEGAEQVYRVTLRCKVDFFGRDFCHVENYFSPDEEIFSGYISSGVFQGMFQLNLHPLKSE